MRTEHHDKYNREVIGFFSFHPQFRQHLYHVNTSEYIRINDSRHTLTHSLLFVMKLLTLLYGALAISVVAAGNEPGVSSKMNFKYRSSDKALRVVATSTALARSRPALP
jgi:hypothetical protein